MSPGYRGMTHCIPWDEHCHVCNPPSVVDDDLRFADGQGWIDARECDPSRDSIQWGEPQPYGAIGEVRLRASCGCAIGFWRDRKEHEIIGWPCERHGFADLVEGEARLREAQNNGTGLGKEPGTP